MRKHLFSAFVVAGVALLNAGCPHCIDDHDDAFEDNDTADEASSLDADVVAQGVVADCDADFFSAGVLAGDILRVVFSGHAASIGEGGQSSGALRIELSRGDESIPVEAAEGEGEGAIAVITPDDDGVTNRIEIDVPAAAEDGEVTIGVIKDSYADNLFPVSDAYDLHASP